MDLNLTYLVSQVKAELATQIEVLISDNSSTDNTKDILKKYESYSFIKTNLNTENLGMDLNFLSLVRKSTGKFVWIFGDDEVLFAGGLQKVITTLEKYPDAGLVHIKAQGHNTLAAFDAHKNTAELLSVEEYTDSQEFLKKVSFNLSFITSHIFNHSFINAKQVADDQFVGSYLNQIGFYLQAAINAKTNLVVTGTVFSQLNNNTGGYKLFEVFGTNQQKILNYFRPFGLADSTIRKINHDLLKSFFPNFIILMGSKNKIGFHQEPALTILFSNFKKFPEFWLFCLPLLMIPSGIRWNLFQLARNLKRSIKSSFLTARKS